jgi:hypothetical protein
MLHSKTIGKFMSPATIKRTQVFMQFADATLKQRNVRLLMAFYRRSLAKQLVMTAKSLRSFSAFVSVAVKHFKR